MLTADHRTILSELALYTTFLTGALSPTAVPTFCELLFGGMLSEHGFVTQALLSVQFQCKWSSYHHWIVHGKWHWKSLACRLIQLVCTQAQKQSSDNEPITLALDDWVVERFSDKAPACRTHHQHSQKRNRPTYIWGLCWVSLAVVLERTMDEIFTAIPVLSFPAPASGNVSKLKIAAAMLKVVRQEVQQIPLRVLADCWYMNWTLMQPAMEMGYEVIGQIPSNRALYTLPEVPVIKKRGRPRKYGVKMTPEEVAKLPEHKVTIWMYGRFRTIHYRSLICRARFLKGQSIRVVWSRFENDKGRTENRIFISTNTKHEAVEILRAYSKRWPIEPMFNQLKHTFGCRQLWQQKLRPLLKWMHIKMAGYALLQLLTVCQNRACLNICQIPWRSVDTVTAGMLRQALAKIIPEFAVREGWNRYHQKYEFPCSKPDVPSVTERMKVA